MTVIHVTPRGLARHLARDARRIVEAIEGGKEATARRAIQPIRKRVPVAFGQLRDSIHAVSGSGGTPPKTTVDAPHAGSVEVGSMPHTPDFERLVSWVKLRGVQGFDSRGRLRGRFAKDMGPTTPRQARRVALMFRERGIGFGPGAQGQVYTADKEAEDIARAISNAIAREGTKPHWFVRESLPEIRNILDFEIKKRVYSRERNQAREVEKFTDAAEKLGIASRPVARDYAVKRFIK